MPLDGIGTLLSTCTVLQTWSSMTMQATLCPHTPSVRLCHLHVTVCCWLDNKSEAVCIAIVFALMTEEQNETQCRKI